MYRWCPDLTGGFDATLPSGDAAAMRLWAVERTGASSVPPAWSAGALGAPVPAGSSPALPIGDLLTVGTRFWARIELSQNGHVRRSPAQDLWIADPNLGTDGIQETGAGIEWSVENSGWQSVNGTLEGEINTTPGFPANAWTTDDVLVVPPNVVRFDYEGAGEFIARLRPMVPGCASGAWTSSQPRGRALVSFVDALATHGGDGKRPSTAFDTIQEAISGAQNGQVIRVRGYDDDTTEFSESLGLTTSTRLQILGGHTSSFLDGERNSQFKTVVRCAAGPSLSISGGPTESSLIDGLTLTCDSAPALAVTNGRPQLRSGNGNDNGSCGDLSADFENTPRTCPSPTDCITRGAFEVD